ncbi:hypothetical protein RHGRI_013369 [Rhododendron griersonianum]|uniref:HMG box domain-containing protein n=1 Tax=Rhododendron griersonianum TaxID=479676 RepID=A0AAV6K5E1_9ERIC|nr:hypothetical protein RHGRI_013369 [Rhododendron griersonianum]
MLTQLQSKDRLVVLTSFYCHLLLLGSTRMKRGQKRPRTEKGSSSGTKAPIESTNSNPYLLFLDDYLKKARTVETGSRFFVSKYSSVAAEGWKNMSDAERAPFLDLANQRKAHTKKNVPKKKKTPALVHHFNPMNKTLAFGRMKVYSITPDDVGRALGLPLGTVPVLTKCEEFHFEHIQAMFAEKDE